jgi:sortase A
VKDDSLDRAWRAQLAAAARERLRRITANLKPEEDDAVTAPPGSARLSPAEHWHPAPAAVMVGAARQPAVERKTAPPGAGVDAAPRHRGVLDRILLAIEVGAVVGLIAIVVLSLGNLGRLAHDLFSRATIVPPLAPTIDAGAWLSYTATPEPLAGLLPSPTGTPIGGVTVMPTGTPAFAVPGATPTATATGQFVPRATPTRAVSTPMTTVTPGATPVSPTGVRVVIPAIGVDAPMVEGDDWDTLKTGIGHRTGTAWPGQVGNVVISAHDDIHGAIFKDLNRLKAGDVVYVYTPQVIYRYEVLFSRLVLPTEVSVMDPTRLPILTLITCYPPFVDTHRVVVTAQLQTDP